MVLAALRLTKEPPYFRSSISTWQKVGEGKTKKNTDYIFTVWTIPTERNLLSTSCLPALMASRKERKHLQTQIL